MVGVFTYIWLIFMVNVHGSYGYIYIGWRHSLKVFTKTSKSLIFWDGPFTVGMGETLHFKPEEPFSLKSSSRS